MKYKGFTLIEMSLALSLMGLLLLMGSEVWNILGQVHRMYSDGQERRYEEIQLRHILEEDLFQYADWAQSGQWLLVQDQDWDTLIAYQFGRDYVLRKRMEQVDTFRFSLYVQPFEQESVVCLIDSTAKVWLKQDIWVQASAIP